MKPKKNALLVLQENGARRPVELSQILGISAQAVHRQLKKLLDQGLIQKKGTPPTVFYEAITPVRSPTKKSKIEDAALDCIDNNFSFLSNSGQLLLGLNGFEAWLTNTKQEKAAQSLSKSYLKLHQEIYAKKANNLFNLKNKLKTTLNKLYLNETYCSDFYSLPQFGKTHLGNLITAGKSGQNKDAIKEISELIKPQLESLIKNKNIEAIAWTPHSISRKVMFLKELKKLLNINLTEIEVVKVFAGNIPIAQKSLSKLSDRIENASSTLYLKTQQTEAKNVLIIDDALGSGATMNEIARKIKKRLNVKNVHAYAVVGSYKGFDVVSVI